MSANCIVDKNNNVVSKMTYAPNITDLNKRGDFVVACADDIVIGDSDFRNGKVVKHTKTQAEIDAANSEIAERASKDQAHQSAFAKFKALGLTDNEIYSLIGGN
jgi:fructose-specific phosphotransferase system component IIB